MHVRACACCICVHVCLCMCVCTKSRYTIEVVHSIACVRVYTKSSTGTFKSGDLIQIDIHLVWQIDKGLPMTYYHILLKIIMTVT